MEEEYDLFVMDLYLEGAHALHTSFEYDFTSTDSEADQMVSRVKALQTEFFATEQTAVAKLKKLNWEDPIVLHAYEFVYFSFYHPFADGDKT